MHQHVTGTAPSTDRLILSIVFRLRVEGNQKILMSDGTTCHRIKRSYAIIRELGSPNKDQE